MDVIAFKLLRTYDIYDDACNHDWFTFIIRRLTDSIERKRILYT